MIKRNVIHRFLLSDHVPTLVLDYVSENDKKKILDEDEPLDKKTKCANSKNRNILKGAEFFYTANRD